MADNRSIRKVFRSKPTIEGAGVHLHRAFANAEVPLFDPFLLLDDFRSDEPRHYLKGFPWHPHRGIETITYVLSGDVEHGDSMGNRGVIGSGDLQWMTAGSGIIHQEMPKGDASGRMYGFQLWANLPAANKMMDPRYRGIVAADIPSIELPDGPTIKVIAGRLGKVQGPIHDVVTDPEYLDVIIPARSQFAHATVPGHTVFAYIIDGKACFCQERNPYSYDVHGANYFDISREPLLGDGSVVLFGDGSQVFVTTEDYAVRFLLVSGKPIGEPVAWYGPIVMNTMDELRTAFDEFNNGTFIKSAR
jgi:quercetin 2,3-dioxygenase